MDDQDAGLFGPVESAPKQGRWDRFKAALSTKSHAAAITTGSTAHYGTSYGYGYGDAIALSTLMRYFESDIYFNLAVRLNADATVGQGYTLSGTDSIKGRQALEIVENWADDNDLDALLQRFAIDGWITGNAFAEWRDGMVKPISQNHITQILADKYGDPEQYQIQRRGTIDKLHKDDILHFRYQVSGGSGGEVYGVGLGQIQARKGVGYKQSTGRTARRPSQFEINEIKDDLIIKVLQAGIPRYMVNVGKSGKDVVESITKKMQNMDLLQHYVSNAQLDVKEMALSPSNKMGDIFRSIESSTAVATMSPVSRLWQDLGFTSYASSQSAMESMLPQIQTFQRALKRFIEREIFRTLLTTNGLDYTKHHVAISFGPDDGFTIEDTADLMSILRDPIFEGRFDPENILDILRDAGVSLDYVTPEMATQSTRNQDRTKQQHIKSHSFKKHHEPPTKDKLRRTLQRRYR